MGPECGPLPRLAGEGEQKGVGAIFPRAFALGYSISPLPGLRKALRHEEDFINELLTQDTSAAARISKFAKVCGNACVTLLIGVAEAYGNARYVAHRSATLSSQKTPQPARRHAATKGRARQMKDEAG